MQLPIIIEEIAIRQDEQGRYCLNDLHKASGGAARHKPANWLRMAQMIELIEEMSKSQIRDLEEIQPLNVIHGGNNKGTYVVEDLCMTTPCGLVPNSRSK